VAIWRTNVHLRRYRQIADVFIRHGLGFVVDIVGLDRFIPFHLGPLNGPRKAERYTRPERLRVALEELGTTFVKLGQILSTRVDLLPYEYQVELAKLQDQTLPLPGELIRDVVVAELGCPIEEIFATFELTPLASASIGQAHAATLRDGTEVVVKVRRPKIDAQIEEDLEILGNFAAVAARRWDLADQYDVVGLSQEFAQTLRAELDYVREGRNAERFASNFAGDERVHIPRVYWRATTARVLTLERLYGCKISDTAALDAAGIDRRVLAQRASRVLFKMTFEDGFFHADPHPGNFLIEPNGRFGLMDFGMVGSIDERTQDKLTDLALAVATQDFDRMVDGLLDLGVARRRIDRPLLRRDLEHLYARYYGKRLGDVVVAAVIDDSLEVIRRHRLQLPPNLALLLKTIVMNEGLGRLIDPTFNLADALAPYGRRLLMRRFSPAVWTRRLSQAGLDAARLGIELPEQLRRIIGEVERGGIEVGVRPEGFDPLIRRFERLANRIILGILVAAFVNGLAILVSVYRPAGWDRWAGLVFAVGFAFAAIVGAYLAWSILRSGRG
jgi:ubiquinone biosynthesis protein